MKRVSVVFLLSIFIFTKFSCVSGNMVSRMVKAHGDYQQDKIYITVTPSIKCFYDNHLMDSLIRYIKREVRGKSCFDGGVEVNVNGVFLQAESGPVPIEAIGRLLTEVDCLKEVGFGIGRKTYSFHMKVSFNGDRVKFEVRPGLQPIFSRTIIKKRNLKALNAEIRYLIEMVCGWLDIDEKEYSIDLGLDWGGRSFPVKFLGTLLFGLKNITHVSLAGYFNWFLKKRIFSYLPMDSIESLSLGKLVPLEGEFIDDKLLKNLKSLRLRRLFIFGKDVTDTGINSVIKKCPNLEDLEISFCSKKGMMSDFLSMKNLKKLRLDTIYANGYAYGKENVGIIGKRLDFIKNSLLASEVEVSFF